MKSDRGGRRGRVVEINTNNRGRWQASLVGRRPCVEIRCLSRTGCRVGMPGDLEGLASELAMAVKQRLCQQSATLVDRDVKSQNDQPDCGDSLTDRLVREHARSPR